MATTQDHALESCSTNILPPSLPSPPHIVVQQDHETDRPILTNIEASEETDSVLSSVTALHKVSQSSLSHMTYDINAHFDEKQKSNVDCQDPMSVVRKLSHKLSLAPQDNKLNREDEIRSKFSGNEKKSVTFSPFVVALSDDYALDNSVDDDDDDDEDKKRTLKMKRSLLWIRKELLNLRKKDHVIAQQFMMIRNEIQRLRLLQTVEQHRNMLDDIAIDAEEEKEYTTSSLCDPSKLTQSVAPPLLRDVGLTKRDVSDRRFSLG